MGNLMTNPRSTYPQLRGLSQLKSSGPSMHSWTSTTSHGWTRSQRGSSVHSTTPSTGSRSIGQSSRKLVSVITTRVRSPYPVNMPWCTTGFISKNSAPRAACAPLPLNRNTSLPSNNPGADPTDAKHLSRSSSRTRGMTSSQALMLTSNNVECWRVLLPQMPSADYFHLRVMTPHHPVPNLVH